jgi:serine/threonine protein kinase
VLNVTKTRLDLASTRFVLPPDARVVDVSDLSDRLRKRIGQVASGSAVVTRPGHRVAAHLVASPLASLLDEFRAPSRLTDAVLRFAHRDGVDPMEILELAFDALALLVNSRILVPQASPDAVAPEPTLAGGQDFAGFEIQELVRSLDDTELYRARVGDGRSAALKIARDPRSATRDQLLNEALILAHLEGQGSPRLLESGSHMGRTFVAMEWCDGVPIGVAAQQSRSAGNRVRLHELVTRMLNAYARLHLHGVLHVDVHPGNLIVRENGEVVILDFGHARFIGTSSGSVDPDRTGIAHFYDPEMARALLAGRVQPAASPASEQYAVAVLSYLLLTGVHPIDAPAVRTELLERIATRVAAPFAGRGVAAWPEVERVLSQALATEPADRFEDLASMARAFAAAQHSGLRPRVWSPGVQRVHNEAVLRVRSLTECVEPRRLAWFALRTANALADPVLLGSADVLTRRLEPGWESSAISAHMARARCDAHAFSRAIEEFTNAARRLDAGDMGWVMLTAAGLLHDNPDPGSELNGLVAWAQEQVDRSLANSLQATSMRLLEARGVLELVARGAAASAHDLRALIEPFEEESTGDVWLWALASDASGDERFLDLALNSPRTSSPTLDAFAQLRLYQLTGEEERITWARQGIENAALRGCSQLDIALLTTELYAPEQARLPPFPFA